MICLVQMIKAGAKPTKETLKLFYKWEAKEAEKEKEQKPALDGKGPLGKAVSGGGKKAVKAEGKAVEKAGGKAESGKEPALVKEAEEEKVADGKLLREAMRGMRQDQEKGLQEKRKDERYAQRAPHKQEKSRT